MWHRYTSISLDREEPSKSHALPTGIVARYDELAERSWIHASRGGASRLYTKVNISEAAKSDQHSSPDKN
jgi:hypothetical protein